MISLTRIIGVLALLGMLVPFANADEILPPSAKDDPLILGLAVIYRDKVYDDFDDGEKAQVLPLIVWEGERFFFRAATGGFKFITNETWEVAAIVEGRGDGYESSDADILAGMSDRDKTVDAGIHGIWRMGNGFGLKGVVVADTLDKSNGYEVRAEGFYETRRGDWTFKPMIAYVYQSDDLVDYYYGVETSEQNLAIGRPAYQADEESMIRGQFALAWNPNASKWNIIAGARVDFFGDEIDDSPIVEDDTMLTGFFGVGYSF